MAVTKQVRIPHSIWRDPEFTGLSRTAQWLWFYLTTRSRPSKFRPEVIARAASDLTADQVLAAAAELRATSYGAVFDRKRRLQTVGADLRAHIFRRDGHHCQTCGSEDDLTIDHIWPVSQGGSDHPTNLQTLCRSCNCRKGARLPEVRS